MIKKFFAALAVAIIAAVGGLAISSPAAAVGNCGAATICFYDTSTSTYPLYECEAVDCRANTTDCRSMSPATSYIENTSKWKWRVFTTNNCTGTAGTIQPYSAGSMTSPWNNSIRSFYRTPLT